MTTPVNWTQPGRIELCEKGWPKFPATGKVPGLYRLRLDDGWNYIGQARNLSHRLYEYRRPTPGVVQEHSIHRAICRSGGACVDVFISEEMSDSNLRFTLEQKEIELAQKLGMKLLNGGDKASSYRLKLDIEYHEKEISSLREELSKRSTEGVDQ